MKVIVEMNSLEALVRQQSIAPRDLALIQRAFDFIDQTGDGKITLKEFEIAMHSLFKIDICSTSELQQLYAYAVPNPEVKLDMSRFLDITGTPYDGLAIELEEIVNGSKAAQRRRRMLEKRKELESGGSPMLTEQQNT